MAEKKQTKREKELLQTIDELTGDIQRVQADFENYRKRVDAEKIAAREIGQSSAVMKLLPVIDNIERAIRYVPEDLKDHSWAQGVTGLVKQLGSSLEGLQVKRIDATIGAEFNPELHEAIQFDEDASGEKEVIAEELQAGYTMNGRVIRHAMVKVTRQ
ncbi:nucleotide exchange factor GrpE [Candidatus Saccharibacteria bacterium]|nr:nucleotide exchange factor GrpE [Candidatus Saccharibacteria bacterium]NCS83319.1 nucleotide exchange factor GrpE [Candidatus Saccharibacteria bacterium]